MRTKPFRTIELPKGAISELSVKNFKSIQELNIEPGRVNVFIGKPNAGKSNLLEAIAFSGIDPVDKSISKEEIRYTDIASLFYDQNYDGQIVVGIGERVYNLKKMSRSENYELRIFFSKNDYQAIETRNFKVRQNKIGSTLTYINKTTGETIQFISSQVKTGGDILENLLLTDSGIRKYHFKGIGKQNSSSNESLDYDGANLWSIITHNSYLKEFANNFFKEYSLEVLYDNKNKKFDIMRKTEDSYYLIDFSMTPDTFQRMLYYLAAIESNKESIILFEEPESQSYPPYIQMLAERIVDDTNNQYFITTHSPFIIEKMLERAGSDKGIKFFVTYFEDYQTKVHELTTKEIDHIVANGVDLFFNIEAFQK